jgi:hypothetical protein
MTGAWELIGSVLRRSLNTKNQAQEREKKAWRYRASLFSSSKLQDVQFSMMDNKNKDSESCQIIKT